MGLPRLRSQTPVETVCGCRDVFHVDGSRGRRRIGAFRDGRGKQIHRARAVDVSASHKHFPVGGNAGAYGLDGDDGRAIRHSRAIFNHKGLRLRDCGDSDIGRKRGCHRFRRDALSRHIPGRRIEAGLVADGAHSDQIAILSSIHRNWSERVFDLDRSLRSFAPSRRRRQEMVNRFDCANSHPTQRGRGQSAVARADLVATYTFVVVGSGVDIAVIARLERPSAI